MTEKNERTIAQFLKDYNLRFSKDTIRSYTISLRQFFNYDGKDYDQITEAEIWTWMNGLTKTGQSPNSVRLKLAALKSYYSYLHEEKLISTNVTKNVKGPGLKEQPLKYLDKKTLARLFELTISNPRDRAIMEVLYATGVRASELLSIQLSDIKWGRKMIWINGKGNIERFVLFSSRCAERMKKYLNQRGFDSPYLFAKPNGEPYSRVWLEHLFSEYSKELNHTFKITPHVMRHTFATHLAEREVKEVYIQELLGHKKIKNTQIYTRLSEEARKKQYDRYQ